MTFKFLIIPTVLAFQLTTAQTVTSTATLTQGTPAAATASTPPAPAEASSMSSPDSGQVTYLDYKSVYEASTIEEEVKMAAERFELTPSQQDMWLTAAGDRRQVEKTAREKLDAKGQNYEKEGIYRGLRASQNTFHETITGYLTPKQKQAMETDRLILQEKQKRMAKLPPPAPPAPTVTVAPVDSSAIKADLKKSKKSKKKKKAVVQ